MSLAEAELTLSGVIQAQPVGASHLPLASALEISFDAVRLVAGTHDKGQVVGVLDAAHLICRPNGALTFGGTGGNPIAPELKRGDAPDRLSDVYALGALMYRLLTGHKVDPSHVVEPPSHFNPAVDNALDELVLETLDEDPSERPYSARELERRMVEIFSDLGLEPGSRTEASKLISHVTQPPMKRAEPKPEPKPTAMRAAPKPEPTPEPKPTVVRAAKLPLVDVDSEYDDEEQDEAEFERPQAGFARFLYDLGWVKGQPRRKMLVPLGADDDDAPPMVTGEMQRPRGGFAGFLYDLGWVKPQPHEKRFVALGADDDEPMVSSEMPRRRNKLSQFMYDLGWLQNIDWDAPRTLMFVKRGAIAVGVLMLIVIVWPSNKQPRLTAAQAALAAQSKKPEVDSGSKAKAAAAKATTQPVLKRANGRR